MDEANDAGEFRHLVDIHLVIPGGNRETIPNWATADLEDEAPREGQVLNVGGILVRLELETCEVSDHDMIHTAWGHVSA